MSYATSLLAAYPSSYGPSTLLSDDLVTRSALDDLYQPPGPYISNNRLLSDDLSFNQISHDKTTYHPPLYSLANPTSLYPTKNYQNSKVRNWHKSLPPNDSFASMNDVTEYSESLATASNTNTASSIARSLNDNNMNNSAKNIFYNHQQNDNQISNDVDSSPQIQSKWSPSQTKKRGQSDEIKTKTAVKQQPIPTRRQTHSLTRVDKKSLTDELNDDVTPVQSPLTKQESHLERNATITETEKPSPSANIQTWLNDTEKESPIDDKSAEQAWSVKIGQLQISQAQREKEKIKALRALPVAPKKVDNKPIVSKTQTTTDTKSHDTTYQTQHDSYFNSIFDGDYFRKQSTNDYTINPSFRHAVSKRSKATTTSFNNPNSVISSKNSKNIPQQKTSRYEPPTVKRLPQTITTNSWRKQWPIQHHYDSTYPYYLHNEYTHRDITHKDTDERFREALQKLRADRAEQQQKDINEKTAKRLNYGDYVRHSTKDALLQNAVKPSPWSDFMDLKKGNLYSLSKEEKKQLYNQSRSYGERVRYRNFAIRYEAETARSHPHSVPLPEDNQELESGYVTPRQTINNGGSKSVSRTSKRPDSGSTVKTINKTNMKQTNIRKNKKPSKKKNVRYAKFDSSGRTTYGTDESDNETDNHNQRNIRLKNRDINDDLFTVREEQTLQSFESSRHKKR